MTVMPRDQLASDMTNSVLSKPTSRKSIWSGTALSVLVTLFMLLDSALHLIVPAPVVEAFNRLSFPLKLSVPFGVLEIACVVVYVIPQTTVLGAIFLTGYLGGAVATHLRAGSTLFETIFPVIIGMLAWGGVFLRDNRLRVLMPFRSSETATRPAERHDLISWGIFRNLKTGHYIKIDMMLLRTESWVHEHRGKRKMTPGEPGSPINYSSKIRKWATERWAAFLRCLPWMNLKAMGMQILIRG